MTWMRNNTINGKATECDESNANSIFSHVDRPWSYENVGRVRKGWGRERLSMVVRVYDTLSLKSSSFINIITIILYTCLMRSYYPYEYNMKNCYFKAVFFVDPVLYNYMDEKLSPSHLPWSRRTTFGLQNKQAE